MFWILRSRLCKDSAMLSWWWAAKWLCWEPCLSVRIGQLHFFLLPLVCMIQKTNNKHRNYAMRVRRSQCNWRKSRRRALSWKELRRNMWRKPKKKQKERFVPHLGLHPSASLLLLASSSLRFLLPPLLLLFPLLLPFPPTFSPFRHLSCSFSSLCSSLSYFSLLLIPWFWSLCLFFSCFLFVLSFV